MVAQEELRETIQEEIAVTVCSGLLNQVLSNEYSEIQKTPCSFPLIIVHIYWSFGNRAARGTLDVSVPDNSILYNPFIDVLGEI